VSFESIRQMLPVLEFDLPVLGIGFFIYIAIFFGCPENLFSGFFTYSGHISQGK